MRNAGNWFLFASLCCALVVTAENPAQDCCTGEVLRLAIRADNAVPFFTFSGSPIPLYQDVAPNAVTGFVPEFLAAVANSTGMTLDYYPVNNTLPPEELNTLVTDMIVNGTIDAYIDFGLDAYNFGADALGGRLSYTVPFFTSPVSGVVKLSISPTTKWTFRLPFKTDLWCKVMLGMLFVALCLLIIQCLQAYRPGDSPRVLIDRLGSVLLNVHGCFTAFYFSLAAFLAGDNYEWPSDSERILRSGWLFFSLIVVATYTANLAAFFTTPNVVVNSPPTGMNDLVFATACTVMLDAQEGAKLDTYVKSFITPPPECQYWDACGQQFCYDAVQSGRADVWIDDGLALHQYIQENSLCRTLGRLPEIKFLPFVSDIFVMMDHSEWPFVGNLSSAMAYENNKPAYLRLLNKYFMAHSACASAFQHVEVSYKEMEGLFLTTLAFCAVAVLHALGLTFVRSKTDSASKQGFDTVQSREAELSDQIAKVQTLLSGHASS
mmetsp:Transcript_27216/g.59447  ORF Transcript_27216/g.59447 Transcript_27216/m.59447 type:complete len:492 (-) Transcript_27216:198-1673(-)